MKFAIMAAVAGIAACFSAGPLVAQNLRNFQAPTEFPPASYKGNQYVDSKGCVYIRAGIDGNVTWVPRVNRQRKLLCGQTPTKVARGTSVTAPAPKAPVQITIDTPVTAAPARVTEQTKPAPRVTAAPTAKPSPIAVQTASQKRVQAPPSPAPAPTVFTTANDIARAEPEKVAVVKPQTTLQRRAVAAPSAAPAPTVFPSNKAQTVNTTGTAVETARQNANPWWRRAAPSSAPAPTVFKTATARANPTPVAAPRQPTCPQTSAVGRGYVNAGQNLAVRCGPQETRALPQPTVSGSASVSPDLNAIARIPEGYRPAWTDDRLNPQRGVQTPEGIASMGMIWTDTVPRRLIDKTSGRDVTATVPLVYPYTDVENQKRKLGKVTIVRRDGQIMKQIVRNKSKAKRPSSATKRSAAVASPKPAAAQQGQYVQVGMFGISANADAAAQRLARSGLPTRMGTLKRGSKPYKLVLAGPFETAAETNQALRQARAAGFSDAFVRK